MDKLVSNLWEVITDKVYRRPYLPCDNLEGIFIDKDTTPQVGEGYIYRLVEPPCFQWYAPVVKSSGKFPEKETAVVLSTCHVTDRDMRILEDEFPCENSEFTISIPVNKEYIKELWKDIFVNTGLSSAFTELYKTCLEEGVDRLRLDADGPWSEHFPTFNW